MIVQEALKQAEHEYAQIDRAQDHLAPDSDGYVDLGPIVPWIVRRAAALCGHDVLEVCIKYYTSSKMNANAYLALDDECSFHDYPDGLRIEVFLTSQAREMFIQSQPDFGDWQTRDLEVRA